MFYTYCQRVTGAERCWFSFNFIFEGLRLWWTNVLLHEFKCAMFKGMVLGTGFPSQVCVHKIMVMQFCSHLLFKMIVKILFWAVHLPVINMLLTFTFVLFSVSLASHNHGTSK